MRAELKKKETTIMMTFGSAWIFGFCVFWSGGSSCGICVYIYTIGNAPTTPPDPADAATTAPRSELCEGCVETSCMGFRRSFRPSFRHSFRLLEVFRKPVQVCKTKPQFKNEALAHRPLCEAKLHPRRFVLCPMPRHRITPVQSGALRRDPEDGKSKTHEEAKTKRKRLRRTRRRT